MIFSSQIDTSTIVNDSLTTFSNSNKIASTADTLIQQTDTANKIIGNIITQPDMVVTELFWGLPTSILRILLPAVISIFLFFLGFFINWLNKKRERKNTLQAIKTLTSTWIELLEKTIKQQANSCRQFAKDLRESDYISTEKFGFVNLLIDRLNEISLSNFTDTFMLNHKGSENENSKQLFNLISSIEYFTNFENEIRNVYKKFENETIEIITQWNNVVRKLDEIKTTYAEKINEIEDHPSKDFYNAFIKIGAEFQQNYPNGGTINQMQKVVFNKLSDETQKFLRHNNKDILAIEVLNLTTDLNIIIRQWNTHRIGYSQLFLEYGIYIIRTYRTILKSIGHFNSLELKSIFKIN